MIGLKSPQVSEDGNGSVGRLNDLLASVAGIVKKLLVRIEPHEERTESQLGVVGKVKVNHRRRRVLWKERERERKLKLIASCQTNPVHENSCPFLRFVVVVQFPS